MIKLLESGSPELLKLTGIRRDAALRLPELPESIIREILETIENRKEHTVAGLASARARDRDRKGGRPFRMTTARLRLAMAAMGQPETKVGDLYQEFGITRQTLYRHLSLQGELCPDGVKLLARV